jgi:hypothetical protein
VLPSVPVKVKVLLAVRVLPAAMVNVPVLEVRVKPLIEVASAAPKVGVTSVGEVAKTRTPVPVSSEITPASWAEVVDAN